MTGRDACVNSRNFLPLPVIQAAMWAAVALCFLQVASFIQHYILGVFAMDSWQMLREAAVNGLDLTDFLSKHAGADQTAQPLHWLLFLVHYTLYDIDFMVESLIGLAFAFLSFLVLHWYIATESPLLSKQQPVLLALATIAVAALLASLNSPATFTMSIVALSYALLLIFFLCVGVAWRAIQGGTLWSLGLAVVVLGVAADSIGILAAAAMVFAVLLTGFKSGNFRRALQVASVILLGLGLARLGYLLLGTEFGPPWPSPALADRLGRLFAGAGDWWRWLTIPASASVAFYGQLRGFFGEHWETAQTVLGILVLAGHVWFWLAALRLRPTRCWFAAVCLMLFCYAVIAGVVYARVWLSGAVYLNQARYIFLYQLAPVALVLMAVAWRAAEPDRRAARLALVGITSILIALQVPLSQYTWKTGPFVLRFQQRMAEQLELIARDPTIVPKGCLPLVYPCRVPLAEREELIGILRDRHLNLFSPQFRRRHHLPPWTEQPPVR